MLKIYLTRIGKKHSSDFRIVVGDKKNSSKGGKFLEVLGNYNPRLKSKGIKEERIKHWMEKGAKPTDTVFNLLVGEKIINAPKKRIKISLKKKEDSLQSSEKEGVKTEVKPDENTEQK